jgi:hypothetical protein
MLVGRMEKLKLEYLWGKVDANGAHEEHGWREFRQAYRWTQAEGMNFCAPGRRGGRR